MAGKEKDTSRASGATEMIWRNPYDRADQERYGKLTATVNLEPSMTKECFAVDADLNVLVQRFGITGVPVTPLDPSQFGDYSDAPDLRGALEIMRDAEDAFNNLPARVRRRFDNSAADLWDFLQNPENMAEAEELGIVVRAETAQNAPGLVETEKRQDSPPPGRTPAKTQPEAKTQSSSSP